MADQTLFARNGALWVQVNGPNTKPEYVACVDVDALSEPGGGIDTLVRCFNPNGQGWTTIGATLSPPDPVTTSITALVTASQNYIEQIRGCPGTFFILQSETGRKDNFGNYVRAWALSDAYIGDRGASDLTMRETDGISTMTFGLTAFPPLYRIFRKATSRQAVGLSGSANAVTFLDDIRCTSGNGPAQGACKIGYIAGDSPVGSPSATGDVFYTVDGGTTWTAASADPFAAAESIAAITTFLVGASTRRVVVARGTTDGSNPAEVAYSDDNGATWTAVDVGETNGQFVQAPGGMFALDARNAWLVTDAGYIYYSEDGCVTWSAQEEGVATSEDLNAVHFADNKVGYAVGTTDAVLRTIDGGVSWSATTANPSTSSDLRTVYTLDAQRAWVGVANGSLYYTNDAGATWTRRRFSGDTSGQVRDIKFVNDLIGYMIHDTSAPVGRVLVTMDGGYTWELVTTTTNSGLNALAVCDENNFYAAGEVNSGTAVLIKAQPQA